MAQSEATQVASPTPEVKTATPLPAEPVKTNGTAPESTSSQAPATEPAEETFTNVDVKSLPPELKSKYDAMLSDYKKKTTEIAEKRKTFESAEKKAQLYDQISSDEAFVGYWNGLSKTQQTQAKEEAGVSDEEFNRAFESKDNFAKFVQKVANVATSQSQAEVTNLKASLMIKDFKGQHEDFGQFERAIETQLKADPRTYTTDEKKWAQALNEAYANAKSFYQGAYEEGRKAGLGRVQEKVNQSTEQPTQSVAPTITGDPKKWSVKEAVEHAKRGVSIKRS